MADDFTTLPEHKIQLGYPVSVNFILTTFPPCGTVALSSPGFSSVLSKEKFQNFD